MQHEHQRDRSSTPEGHSMRCVPTSIRDGYTGTLTVMMGLRVTEPMNRSE